MPLRKNDGDRAACACLGKTAEERVDRQIARVAVFDENETVAVEQNPRVRSDVNVVRFQRFAALNCVHRHRRHARENVRERARVRRILMNDHDEREAGVFGDGAEELADRFEAACRGADADNWKTFRRYTWLWPLFSN